MLKSKGVIKLIEINENWSVDTDGDKNVILMKKVEKRVRDKQKKTWVNTGEYDWSVYGYYPTLEQLVKDITRKELRSTKFKDLDIVLKKVEELEDMVKKLKLK